MNNQRNGSASLSCAERTYGKVVDLTKLNRDAAWRVSVAAQQRALADKLSSDTLILNSCPICHSGGFELFVEIYGFPYCECGNCGHIFSQKPPSAQAVQRLYTRSGKDNQSIQSQLYVNKELFATRVMDIAAPKVRYVTTRLPSQGKWVDIGCGTGEILCAAKAQGWDVLGIESDPDEVEFARNMGIEVEQVFIEPDNVRQYVKDAAVVSLINILEHVLFPERLLKAIADSINEDTRIVIEVPRHPSLSSYANKTFPHLAVRHIYAPDHLHIFTEKAMDILFNRLGLIPKNIWLFGQDFYEIISSMASLIECQNTALYNEVLRAVGSTQAAIDKLDLADTAIIILMKR
jgi:SAM-dependent methyltransferase